MRALLAFLILVLFAGCDTFQAVPGGEAPQRHDTASKAVANIAPSSFMTHTFVDVGGQNRTLTYATSRQEVDPLTGVLYTNFYYDVDSGGSEGANDVWWFSTANTCDNIEFKQNESSANPGWIKVPNGGSGGFSLVISTKYSDSDDQVLLGESLFGVSAQENDPIQTSVDAGENNIAGPSCTGFDTIPMSGFVYIDNVPDNQRNSDGKIISTYPFEYDGKEAGVGGVAVDLYMGPNLVATDYTNLNSAQGEFVFAVPDPLKYGESTYTIRLGSTTGDVNPSLFNSNCVAVLRAVESCEMEFGAALPSYTSPDIVVKDHSVKEGYVVTFPLLLDVSKARNKFTSGEATTEGMPREFWKVQATGKGSPKYKPVMSPDDFVKLLGCALGDSAYPLCMSFGDDQVNDIFGSAFATDDAIVILRNDSKSDELMALKTQILVALLNYNKGYGITIGGFTGDTEMIQRTIISNAMNVLRSAEGYICGDCALKIGEGSVGENTALLGEMNGG